MFEEAHHMLDILGVRRITDIIKSAPALVVQVSNRAVHELVGSPLQGHDVSRLVQGQVTGDSLHVVPLKQQQRGWMFFIRSKEQ